MTAELRGRVRRSGNDEDQGGSRWPICNSRDVDFAESTEGLVEEFQDAEERLCRGVAVSLEQGGSVAMSLEPSRRGKMARMTLHDSIGRCLVSRQS
jgi:hypothetical protein